MEFYEVVNKRRSVRQFEPREIPREACQAGDLLYFPGHMAMYLGGDRFVHASARAGKVCCGSLRDNAEGYWADLAERLFCIGSIFPL